MLRALTAAYADIADENRQITQTCSGRGNGGRPLNALG